MLVLKSAILVCKDPETEKTFVMSGDIMIETHKDREEAVRVLLLPNTELSFKAVACVAQ